MLIKMHELSDCLALHPERTYCFFNSRGELNVSCSLSAFRLYFVSSMQTVVFILFTWITFRDCCSEYTLSCHYILKNFQGFLHCCKSHFDTRPYRVSLSLPRSPPLPNKFFVKKNQMKDKSNKKINQREPVSHKPLINSFEEVGRDSIENTTASPDHPKQLDSLTQAA